MKTTLDNLIVISPQNAGLHRIHISRPALLILAAAFVLSFCSTVFLLLSFPRVEIRDTDHSPFYQVRHEAGRQPQNTNLSPAADLNQNVRLQSSLLNQ